MGMFGGLKRLALRLKGKREPERTFPQAAEYSVLAAIWDNEDDAAYDDL